MNLCEHIAEESSISKTQLIEMLGINRPKYYDWLARLGIENHHNGKIPKSRWVTPAEKQAVINYAQKHLSASAYHLRDGYRRIAYMGLDENVFAVSPATVYRILKKAGLLNKWKGGRTTSKGKGYNQPAKPHMEWHTDIKYVNYHGTFLFFIGIMDGYSRYIVHHELRTSMTELDVEITLQKAKEKHPEEKPRIISDNGSQYISKDFQVFLKQSGLQHVKTSASYPQSNGKIERFHRSLEEECLRTKSMINIEDAKIKIAQYVDHYNNHRLHSSLFYLRPIDFLNGSVQELLNARQKKLDTATAERNAYWKEKYLDNTIKNNKFDVPDKAEMSNAGAQLIKEYSG